jgi:hypothetical protein
MEPLREEEELDFSADPVDDEDLLDFDIDELDDADIPDDVALERELGQGWRSGHPFREDA